MGLHKNKDHRSSTFKRLGSTSQQTTVSNVPRVLCGYWHLKFKPFRNEILLVTHIPKNRGKDLTFSANVHIFLTVKNLSEKSIFDRRWNGTPWLLKPESFIQTLLIPILPAPFEVMNKAVYEDCRIRPHLNEDGFVIHWLIPPLMAQELPNAVDDLLHMFRVDVCCVNGDKQQQPQNKYHSLTVAFIKSFQAFHCRNTFAF